MSELKDDFKKVFKDEGHLAGWEKFFDDLQKIDATDLKQVSNALNKMEDASSKLKAKINNLEKKDSRTENEEKKLKQLKETDAKLDSTRKDFIKVEEAGTMAANTKNGKDLRENIDDITETYNKLLESLERRFAS